jgi:hypothetical protein
MYQAEALVWVLFRVLDEKVRGVEGHAEQYRPYPLCSAHSHGVCLMLRSADQHRRGAQTLHLRCCTECAQMCHTDAHRAIRVSRKTGFETLVIKTCEHGPSSLQQLGP